MEKYKNFSILARKNNKIYGLTMTNDNHWRMNAVYVILSPYRIDTSNEWNALSLSLSHTVFVLHSLIWSRETLFSCYYFSFPYSNAAIPPLSRFLLLVPNSFSQPLASLLLLRIMFPTHLWRNLYTHRIHSFIYVSFCDDVDLFSANIISWLCVDVSIWE